MGNGNDNLENKDPIESGISTVEQKDNFDEAKKEADKAQAETKEGSEALQETIVDSATAKQESQTNTYIARQEIVNESNLNNYEQFMYYLTLNSPSGFEKATDKLIHEIDDALKDARKKGGLTKAGKKTLDNAKNKLIDYKKTLNNKINKYNDGSNKRVYADDIEDLKNMRQNVEEVKHDIARGQRGELSDDAGYTYNSLENAKSSNKAQERMIKFEEKLKQEVKDGAIKNIFGNNEQEAINFYRRIAEGRYTQTDYVLFVTHSDILSPSFKNFGIAIPTDPTITVRNLSSTPTTDYSNLEWGETFQKGGIAGLIDKGLSNCKNMTPGQRTSRKNIAVLGCVAGGIYGLYKFFTNKKMSFWSKALTTGGVIFASQALTGEGPLALFNRLMKGGFSSDYLKSRFGNLFGEAVDGIGNSGIETIAPAMYSMMIFDSSTTIGDINTLTQSFKQDKDARKIFYNDSINKLTKGGLQSAIHFTTTFSDTFDEQKRNDWLASFGVVDISNPSNSNKSIYELANNASMNQIAIEKFKSENGVKIRKDKNKEFKEYVNSLKTNNKAIDIDELKKHPDWFEDDKDATYTERPEDENNKKLLVNKVDSLPLDNETKDKLRIAIQTFYDKRTIESKPKLSNFNLDINGDGNLVLESHGGYKTNIDLKKNELVGFGDGITFSILDDLLNTADLTNKILESQQSHTPKDMPPFQYKRERKGICFNNANSLRQDIVTRNNSGKDTRVLSTGRGGATSEIENLSRYSNEYAAYLSKRWEEEHQANS